MAELPLNSALMAPEGFFRVVSICNTTQRPLEHKDIALLDDALAISDLRNLRREIPIEHRFHVYNDLGVRMGGPERVRKCPCATP